MQKDSVQQGTGSGVRTEPCCLSPRPPPTHTHNITHDAKCHTGLQESKKVLPSREWPLRRKPSSLDPEEHKVLVVTHGTWEVPAGRVTPLQRFWAGSQLCSGVCLLHTLGRLEYFLESLILDGRSREVFPVNRNGWVLESLKGGTPQPGVIRIKETM